jgi:hypothetical protein
MKTLKLFLALAVSPVAAFAQDDPVARLRQVLPEAVADEVIAMVQDARARGLPEQAVASLALEGVAKGRSGEQVREAARELTAQLTEARAAFDRAGRPAGADELQAAAFALRQGVDGAAVSELARSTPSGRSLNVPLAMIGDLTGRGLPSDQALDAVQEMLNERVPDGELAAQAEEAGRLIAAGMAPELVGLELASQRAGFQVPRGGFIQPPGPPAWVPPTGGFGGERPKPPVGGPPGNVPPVGNPGGL